MKRFALLLLVFALVLGSVSMVSAQDTTNQDAFQVTVNWDGSNTLSLSDTNLPANQPVEFMFQEGNNQDNFTFVVWELNDSGTDDDALLELDGQQVVIQSDNTAADNTFTFTDEGNYTLAVYDAANQDTQVFTRDGALATADFSVSAQAGQDNQAQAAQTGQDQTAAQDDQGPQNLPTTGGAPWAMIALVLGALALIAGGALLATRPTR